MSDTDIRYLISWTRGWRHTTVCLCSVSLVSPRAYWMAVSVFTPTWPRWRSKSRRWQKMLTSLISCSKTWRNLPHTSELNHSGWLIDIDWLQLAIGPYPMVPWLRNTDGRRSRDGIVILGRKWLSFQSTLTFPSKYSHKMDFFKFQAETQWDCRNISFFRGKDLKYSKQCASVHFPPPSC